MAQKNDGTETMSEAVARLTKAGYREGFRAIRGRLQNAAHQDFDPGEFVVDTIVRFEGTTDLDDESAIFALTHVKSQSKGLYIVAFGPQMDTADVEVVQKLNKR